MVKFNDKTRAILLTYLKLYNDEEEQTVSEQIDETLVGTEFEIIPKNYANQSCYKTSSKEIMTWCRKKFTEGIASIQSFENEDKNSKGFFLVPDKGVVIFKVFDNITIEQLSDNYYMNYLSMKYNSEKKQIINKFLESKKLCNIGENSKILKFPVKYVYLFHNIFWDKVPLNVKNNLSKLNIELYFRNFNSYKNIFENFNHYSSDFNTIPYELYANIMERVVPENTTLLVSAPELFKHTSVKPKITDAGFVPLTGEEKEYKALRLDDDQINFINNTKTGHWLTLANPGTGKSVILLSKAYRLLSINSSYKVLITCFNKNLCDHHIMFSEITGLRNENLHLLRFYQLVFKLLDDHKISYNLIDSLPTKEEKLEKAAEILNNNIDSGKIKPLFDAIFIDEVQLFNPLWISICYKLLKNKDNTYFDLYGDLNQCVRSAKLKGKASWQDKTYLNFNWQGRTRYLSKNYRNSYYISEYVKQMIFEFNQKLDYYGANVFHDLVDLNSEVSNKKNGNRKILVLNVETDSLANKVVTMVRQIHEKWNADYNDIAIIFPASQLGPIKYYPLNWITNKLSEAGIEYSILFGDDKATLMTATGVNISTVDSALGLDFKHVILCGVKYWSYFWTTKKPELLTELVLKFGVGNTRTQALQQYTEIGRKIYSACSRAREGLIILDDLPDGSPISSIFTPKGGTNYYEEK